MHAFRVVILRLAVLCLALALVFTLGSGCAYDLIRYERAKGQTHSIAIPTLDNGSSEPGLELLVSRALRDEVTKRQAFALIEDPERADYVMRGRVRPLLIRPRSVSSVVLALEYQITMEVNLAVERADAPPLRIDPRALLDEEIYLASDDFQLQTKNRWEALRRMSTEIASRVHDSLDQELFP